MSGSKELQDLSAKLSLLVRLTVLTSDKLSGIKAVDALEITKDLGFETQEISNMFGIPVKTLRNVKAKIKNV